MARTKNPDFMNGVPELLILRMLKDREMYGYDLVRAIRSSTGGEIALGEGVIYPTLHDLESKGFLDTRLAAKNGRTRIYYKLTRKGFNRLTDTAGEWSRIAVAVAKCMEKGAPAAAAA
jgi:PadR family transcriptional regulator PadR